jgi:hypothetical protein
MVPCQDEMLFGSYETGLYTAAPQMQHLLNLRVPAAAV